MSEKSSTVAVVLSFLFTGIGLVYLGNKSKGLMLFGLGVFCNILGMFVLGFFHYISILIWIISLFITYKDSKKVKRQPARPYQYSRRVRHYDRDYDRYYDGDYDRYYGHESEVYNGPAHYNSHNQNYGGNNERYYGRENEVYGPAHYNSHNQNYGGNNDRYFDRENEVYGPAHYRSHNRNYDRGDERY